MRKTQQNKRFRPIYFTATNRKTALQPILIRVAHRADKEKESLNVFVRTLVMLANWGYDLITFCIKGECATAGTIRYLIVSYWWCVLYVVHWFVVKICVMVGGVRCAVVSVVCVRRGLLPVRGGQIGKAQGGARGYFWFPISQFFCNSNFSLSIIAVLPFFCFSRHFSIRLVVCIAL